MSIFDELDKLIGKDFEQELNQNTSYIRKHPLDRMLKELKYEKPYLEKKNGYGYKLASAILYVKKNHPQYFDKAWARICQTKDNYSNAVGICGELRCLYILENSRFKVENIQEKKGTKTPDFKVTDYYGNELYVEVFTPRMNNSAREELMAFHSKEMPRKEGQCFRIDMMSYSPMFNEVDRKKELLIALSKRLLGEKREGKQAQDNKVNILWINIEDSDLGIENHDLNPFISKRVKDDYLTSNSGIWQMFYGKKDNRLFGNTTWLRVYQEEDNIKAPIDGYFREGSKWSGVIFGFNDCQVFYQNPWTDNPILPKTKSQIMRMIQFNLQVSWIDISDMKLEERIDLKIEEIEMLHEMLNSRYS